MGVTYHQRICCSNRLMTSGQLFQLIWLYQTLFVNSLAFLTGLYLTGMVVASF